MSPIEPSGEPPSGGMQRPSDSSIAAGGGASGGAAGGAAGGADPGAAGPGGATVTGSITQPIPGSVARARSQTWFGETSALRRFVTRWGFPLFVVLILVLGHEVLLPFVFAGLIAYILAPVVRWMVDRRDGTRRMPRGVAIMICYLVFISLVAGFLFLLVPRLSRDMARLGKEAPGLYKRINEEWTPEVAHWLEGRFPSLSRPKPVVEEPPSSPTPRCRSGTAFTADAAARRRLRDAAGAQRDRRQAASPTGQFHIQTNETRPSRRRWRTSCARSSRTRCSGCSPSSMTWCGSASR